MGRVRDEVPSNAAKVVAKGGPAKGKGNRLAPFFTNLVRTDVFKPTQGRNARLWTGLGLGVLVLAGLYQLFQLHLKDQYGPVARFAIPTALAAAFGWIIWRILNYPPFTDFLIGTEAEMNKVSWTSREDLKRATIVVMVSIILMAAYLFAVDRVWSWILELFGVLKFASDSFGSQAG